ncbi:carbon-nitrogen hydrolase family protein [Streptomyces iranensis]|uniref:Amidohydrolase n=1 Tax=Streptomyces iranensis TaxID=576784 RepID=A0A061AE63_9ACTN|nr:carbon-nitrogen hydrolase family protein [Streptomyces iranensis]MBP2067622.1 putative amidohydrolase [Streptomyces iranensis]CDR18177.1 Nitrilase/cyanide hydratase and apolipoprotein N-acyltransferase [Streptomyces iranensis]
MSRPLPLVLAQAAQRPAADLDGLAADVRRRTAGLPAAPLVVYPELHLGGAAGHADPAEVPEALAEPLGGSRDRALAEIAGDLGIWLAPGSLYERGTDGRVYNTAPVYSPHGERIAAYRKIFPWRPYETVTPGAEFTVLDLDGIGRVGLSICYDAWFPETTRHLAWMGAELVLNFVQTSGSDRAQELVLSRANAIVNQLFVAGVNCAAPVGTGRSLLIDPQGAVRSEAAGDSDTTLTDVIDLDEVTNVRRLGTAALNRPWQQFRPDDRPLALPLYQGRIDPATWTGATAPTLLGHSTEVRRTLTEARMP